MARKGEVPTSITTVRDDSPERRFALLGLIFCNQSAVTMRVGAGLTRTEFTFLFGGGSTGRTRNRKCLFEAEFFFHRRG